MTLCSITSPRVVVQRIAKIVTPFSPWASRTTSSTERGLANRLILTPCEIRKSSTSWTWAPRLRSPEESVPIELSGLPTALAMSFTVMK